MHPEKVIDGKTGTSGLRFFFWTQSFGRITGENNWDNGAPFSFLFENMLWSFLPWILLFVVALMVNIWQLARQKFRLSPRQEWISTGGFLLSYIALGSSHYQLPHYIFVAFPLAAIMVAGLLKSFFDGHYAALYRIMKPAQLVVGLLLFVAAALTFAFVFTGAAWTYIVWGAAFTVWLIALLHKRVTGKIFWSGTIAIMAANVFMTNHFYYNLLRYQAGSRVGRVIRAKNIPAQKIIIADISDPLDAMHFYAQRAITSRADTLPPVRKGDFWVTGKDCLTDVQEEGFSYDIIDQGNYYKVSELTPEFLNPSTRAEALKKYYLIRIR